MENQIPITQNTQNKEVGTLLLPQKEKKKMTCISITCWILQILIWAGAITLLYMDVYRIEHASYFGDREYISVSFIFMVIFEIILYITYVIFQFYSPTYDYLKHKRTDINLYKLIEKLFITPPKIQFVCECYHYEKRTYTTTDVNGNSVKREEMVKVITKIETKFFDYYSSRDVSGLFNLNYDKSKITNKFYVKLELLTDFGFADAITFSDYQKEKDEFYNKNLHVDVFMDFHVNNIVDGLTSYNLINITDSNPCGMSVFWFIFFSLIGIAQLYKMYINSKCIYKSFTIRKIISSRYKLTTEECDIKYKNVDPVISYEDLNIRLATNEFGYISNDFNLQLPTQEEIESAQQYKDKVFIASNTKENGSNLEFKNVIDNNNDELDNSLKTSLIPDQIPEE